MKKDNVIQKLLKKRMTDASFKMIFFSTAFLVVLSVFFLLSQVNNLRESYESIANQKSITILDESGNVFKKKLFHTNIDIATLFSISYVKKSLGYSYLNYNRIQQFMKIYSTRDVARKHYLKISKSLKQLKIVNGTNITTLSNYKIQNDSQRSNKDFIFEGIITQKLISESLNQEKTFYVRMKIKFDEPTSINSSGMYITSYQLELYDQEKHEQIFE